MLVVAAVEAQHFCQMNAKSWVPFTRLDIALARERVHRPADSDPNQQKQKQRPDDVFYAVARPSPAQKSKRNGNQQREERHCLKMGEGKPDRGDHALRPRAAS